jgi:hypothetical protein
MRVITVCLVFTAVALGACGKKAEDTEVDIADGPSARVVVVGKLTPEAGGGAEAARTSSSAPDGVLPTGARPSQTTPTRSVSTAPPILTAPVRPSPRAPTRAEAAASERDSLRLFRACLRQEGDAQAFSELGRDYWQTEAGGAVLRHCAQWSGLGWPPRIWGGGSANPNEEEL